jgi:hypothetical protein
VPTLTVAPSPVKPAAPKLTGRWAPKLSACSRKDGDYLPLIIDGKGARAGEATCSFRNTQQTGARWKVVAACSSATESWTSKVDLARHREGADLEERARLAELRALRLTQAGPPSPALIARHGSPPRSRP